MIGSGRDGPTGFGPRLPRPRSSHADRRGVVHVHGDLHEAHHPGPARHRPAAQRLRRGGGGRRRRRPPLPPRRRDARERPRPGLRGAVHARARRPAPHGDLHRRLERGGRRGGPRGGQEDILRPVPVSVLFDANGSNTTAAAAVLAALEATAVRSKATRAVVLAATGPVGQRVARLLGRLGGDRSPSALATSAGRAPRRAAPRRDRRQLRRPSTRTATRATWIAARSRRGRRSPPGPAGVPLLPAALRQALPDLKALIDLNAVPPLGIEGVEATDKATDRDGVRAWGALGVGGTKMKIHKKAIQAALHGQRQSSMPRKCWSWARISSKSSASVDLHLSPSIPTNRVRLGTSPSRLSCRALYDHYAVICPGLRTSSRIDSPTRHRQMAASAWAHPSPPPISIVWRRMSVAFAGSPCTVQQPHREHRRRVHAAFGCMVQRRDQRLLVDSAVLGTDPSRITLTSSSSCSAFWTL